MAAEGSPPGILTLADHRVDLLDIHHDETVTMECGKETRNRTSDGEESGTEESAKKKVRCEESVKGKTLDKVSTHDRPRPDVVEGKDGKKVVLVKFLDDNPKSKFTNPKELNEVLNKSPFSKYVVQFSVRNLGNGSGCRFEIIDNNGRLGPIEDIKMISGLKVRCWYPAAPATFLGKIGPISNELSDEYLLRNLEILESGRSNAVITSVRRMKNNDGTPSEYIIIGALGKLPELIATDNVAFPVQKYHRPPLRCFKCHLFGHGTLTCKSPKKRCVRCGEFHDNLNDCNKDYFCIFCKGSHRYSSRECQVNVRAKEIESKKGTNEITFEDAREEFRDLNRLVRNTPTNRPRPQGVINSGAGSAAGVRARESIKARENVQIRHRPQVVTESFSDMDSFEAFDLSYSTAVKSRPRHRPRPKNNKSNNFSSPNRSKGPIPPRSFFSHNDDSPHFQAPITSSEIYNAQISGPRAGRPEAPRSEFLSSLLRSASDLYDVYSNGKPFAENFMEYFNIVSNFIRSVMEPSQ